MGRVGGRDSTSRICMSHRTNPQVYPLRTDFLRQRCGLLMPKFPPAKRETKEPAECLCSLPLLLQPAQDTTAAWTLEPSPPAGLGPPLQEVSCLSQHQHLLPFCLIVLFCTHTNVLITSFRKERGGRKEGGKEDREGRRKKKRKEGGKVHHHIS